MMVHRVHLSIAIVGGEGSAFCYTLQSEKKAEMILLHPAIVQSPRVAMPGTLTVLVAVSEWTAMQVFFSLTQLRVFLHTNKPNGPG